MINHKNSAGEFIGPFQEKHLVFCDTIFKGMARIDSCYGWDNHYSCYTYNISRGEKGESFASRVPEYQLKPVALKLTTLKRTKQFPFEVADETD